MVLVVLLGGAWWFWSLGNPIADQSHAFRVQNIQGSVDWKQKGTDVWKTLTATQDVASGDALRTGAGSSAEIAWDDRGVTRLDANTQMTIENAPADPGSVLQTQIALRLDAGRMWSRLLKLMDVDSSFAVKTDTTVATVRGTIFGFERSASGTRVLVSESVVGVAPASGNGASTLLRDHQVGDFTDTGSATSVRTITDADDWASKNAPLDQSFDAAWRKKKQDHNAQLQRNLPEWMIEASERMRLASAPASEQQDLIVSFLMRRLAAAQADPSHAREILGGLDLSSLQGAAQQRALREISDMLFFEEPRPGHTPESGWYETLRSMRITLLTSASHSDAYARALVIDDAIDGVLFPPSPLSADDLRTRIIDINGQITAWERVFGTTDALRRKAEALRDRLSGFSVTGALLPDVVPAIVPTTDTASSTTSTITLVPVNATGTNGIENPPTTPTRTPPAHTTSSTSGATAPPQQTPPVTTPPANPVATCVEPAYMLIPSPGSTQVGQSVTLQLFATCRDGRVEDLTDRTTFSLADATTGQLSGKTFTPSIPGSPMVRGVVLDANAMRGASATITVTKVVRKLTAVRAIAVGSTTLTTGQSSPLDATAVYSDGSTTDIKYQCNWSTSDPRLAMISSATFLSLSGTGSVSAVCSYTENDISKSGNVDFTISLDPSLTPTNGSTPTRTYNPYTYVP
jgi:hypothetical protein